MKEQINLIINEFNERKAQDIRHVDLEGANHPIADHIIIVSALNEIHLKALVDGMSRLYKDQKNDQLNDLEYLGVSGKSESLWVILDFDNLLIHVMEADIREQYQIDALFEEHVSFTYH